VLTGRPAFVNRPRRERLKTLERENRELREASEILGAASFDFANELDRLDRGERVQAGDCPPGRSDVVSSVARASACTPPAR